MIPAGGLSDMVGHHEVRHNLTTNITTIHSEEGKEIKDKIDFFDFARILNNDREFSNEMLNTFFKDFNKVFANDNKLEFDNFVIEPQDHEDNLAFRGLSSLVMES